MTRHMSTINRNMSPEEKELHGLLMTICADIQDWDCQLMHEQEHGRGTTPSPSAARLLRILTAVSLLKHPYILTVGQYRPSGKLALAHLFAIKVAAMLDKAFHQATLLGERLQQRVLEDPEQNSQLTPHIETIHRIQNNICLLLSTKAFSGTMEVQFEDGNKKYIILETPFLSEGDPDIVLKTSGAGTHALHPPTVYDAICRRASPIDGQQSLHLAIYRQFIMLFVGNFAPSIKLLKSIHDDIRSLSDICPISRKSLMEGGINADAITSDEEWLAEFLEALSFVDKNTKVSRSAIARNSSEQSAISSPQQIFDRLKALLSIPISEPTKVELLVQSVNQIHQLLLRLMRGGHAALAVHAQDIRSLRERIDLVFGWSNVEMGALISIALNAIELAERISPKEVAQNSSFQLPIHNHNLTMATSAQTTAAASISAATGTTELWHASRISARNTIDNLVSSSRRDL